FLQTRLIENATVEANFGAHERGFAKIGVLHNMPIVLSMALERDVVQIESPEVGASEIRKNEPVVLDNRVPPFLPAGTGFQPRENAFLTGCKRLDHFPAICNRDLAALRCVQL